MGNIYKTLRDIGINLANINESIPLLEQATIAVQDLIKAQEAYALVMDVNGRLHFSYSSTPTPKSIEELRKEIVASGCNSDCTTACLNTDGHVCIRLSTTHLIYLISSDCSPKQNKMLELFREQTSLQLRGILQHEKTAAALRDSKNKYRDLLGSLQEGIWAIDIEANTTFVNRQMAEMLGYTIEEMLGKHLFSFMDEEGVEIATEELARREQGIEEQHPFKFLSKDGQAVYTLIETSSIIKDGEYAGAVAGVMDITERERAFNELRYSEKRFRDLVETTSDWIWEMDANGVYTYSSKVITDLLGYAPEEIIGTTPFDLMIPEDAERIGKLFAEITAKKAPFAHLWNVNKHKNGKLVPISTAGVPILDADGELLGYRGIDRDITMLVEQKNARTRARQQTQLLLSVISGISEAPDFQTALEAGLRLVSDYNKWVYSEAWIADSHTGRLFNHAQFFPPEYQERLSRFSALSWDTTFALEEGVPGWTWVSQETVWYENIQALPHGMYLRLEVAKEAGLKAALAVPAIVNGETMAVLMFYTDCVQERESEAMQLITAVASQLGLILQQKQTGETLRKLSRAIEQSATGIFITNLDGEIEFTNPALSEISGYSSAEILGKKPSLFRSENTSKSVHRALWEAVQSGGMWEGRMENRRKDGSFFWSQSIISTIKDQSGNPTHYLCIQSDITVQMAAETALQASEVKNRALIEAIPDMIFLLNAEGVFLDNYGAEEELLLPPEEFINKNIRDVMPPHTYEPAFIAIEAALHTRETQQYSYALSIDDGLSLNYYDARVVVITDNRLLMIVRDMTMQRRAEADLQETRHSLAKAQELSHVGSWDWNTESGRILWSDETYRIFGYQPQSFEPTYSNFLEMIHPEDVEELKTAVLHCLNTHEPYSIKHRTKRPFGEIRYVQEQGKVICNENGDVTHMIGAVLDITDQVIAQQKIEAAKEAAQQSERKLARAQAIAHLGNWEWDAESQLVIWSDETYRMAGYEPQSFPVTRAKFLSMLHPDDVEREQTAVKQSLSTGKPYLVTYRFKRPSGEVRYIEERGEPIYTNGGLHLMGTTLDITKQFVAQQKLEKASKVAQELQSEAERANRAKSMFLTNMSHELRTPLNGILGYTQLFKQDASLSAQQLHGIDVIHRSGEHLLFMINDMLDLAKIEAGKMTLTVNECHLPDMLAALINMVEQLAQQKGILFSHRLAVGLPQMVMTDGVRLRQILLNLLSNAVKFTDSGAILLEVLPIQTAVLSPKPATIKIRFRVEDTGIGIAPELLNSIFSPFEQVSTVKDSIDGTGLGLAISQQLTLLLGGILKVSSRLDQGTIFWFDLELPVAQSGEDDKGDTKFTSTPISGVQGNKKVRLLIVDDTESNRLILSSYFSALSGFDIMEAYDGEDAVAKAKAFKPHLILMDLRMPVMDGLEAARQIRLLPTLEKSIIIAVSANAYINIKEEMLEAGFDGFFVKPIKLTQLAERIRVLLGDEWEWLYDQKQIETAVIIPLPEKETAVLLELARNGDIKNLRGTLSTFKQRLNPQYFPIIEQLIQLARQYRVGQIREQLEKQT